MPTVPQHKTVNVTIANNIGPFAIPDSSKYTRFLILITGCTDSSVWSVTATVGGITAPVPIVCMTNLAAGADSAATATKPANPLNLSIQVYLAAPATGGISLLPASNSAAGTAKVSMWGSAYSHPQRG